MKDKKDFFKISDFAEQVIQNNDHSYKKYKVLNDWSEIVGPRIAKFSSILKYEKSVLHIISSEPMWLSEIYLSKDSILEKYRRMYADLEFKDIKVVLDKKNFKDKDFEHLRKVTKEQRKKESDTKKQRLNEIAPPYDFKIGIFDFIN